MSTSTPDPHAAITLELSEDEAKRLIEWFKEFDWADGCQDGADQDDIELKVRIEEAMRRGE